MANPKLCQIIAVEKGAKERYSKTMTNLHRISSRRDDFEGLIKKYQPKDEEGHQFPTESKSIDSSVDKNLAIMEKELSEVCRVVGTKEFGNIGASADVVLNGVTLVNNAPVPFLLFMEKKLVDLRTFASELPILNAAIKWSLDEGQGLYRSEPYDTLKTSKEEKALIMYDATDKHPAQVKTVMVDTVIGTWTNTRFSGAMPSPDKVQFIERIEQVLTAVKYAREQANTAEVLEYTFPDLMSALFNE